MIFRVLASRHFTYPEIECSKNSKHSPHTLYIVEVCYYVVSIVQSNVHTRICLYNSSKSTNCKLYQESQSKQHRSCQPQGSSVESPKPAKNFNSSRNSNNHCCTSKICTGIYIESNRVHVMSPYLEPQHRNSSHSINHTNITEYWFSCKEAKHVAHNAKSRHNKYIDLRMPEEPELMLILYYIPSPRRQEETSIKITISQKHGKPSSKHRKTPDKQNANKTQCPHKQRKTVQGHPLSTHVCNSYQEIDRSQNTSNTCYVQTKNCQINRSPGVTLCTTKRRIRCPPNTRSLLYQSTQQQQDHSHWQYPEANVVHTRKCHIGCSNHNGYEPVRFVFLCFHKKRTFSLSLGDTPH